jgi:uncharacterized protein involved in exopolysaccharide biosynthesis
MNGQNYNNQPICIEEDEIDLRELFATIWKHKIFILFFVFIVTSLAIVFALSKPNEYKVSITLAPQEQSKGLNLGGLGALASMAGVNVGGSSGITPDIAFQTVLGNYKFMTNFIQKHNIDKILLNNELEKDYIFAMNNNSVYKYFHNSEKKDDEKQPTLFDIYKDLSKQFSISTDKKTGLINIDFTSPSREFAYKTLNQFLEDSTNYLVERNLKDLNSQINRYQKELKKTDNLELKAELAKLISGLIKQKVYINSSKYYKVKVITDPYIPDVKDKVKPKRALIVIVAFITSFILAIFLVFFIEFIRGEKEEKEKI